MLELIETFGGFQKIGMGIFLLFGVIVGDNRFRLKRVESLVYVPNPNLQKGA